MVRHLNNRQARSNQFKTNALGYHSVSNVKMNFVLTELPP